MHEVLPRDSARRDAAPSDDTPRHPETLAGKNLVGELERVVDEEAKARRRKKPPPRRAVPSSSRGEASGA